MSSKIDLLCKQYPAANYGPLGDQLSRVSPLLKIVETAVKFEFQEVIKKGIKHIACFSSKTYSGPWESEIHAYLNPVGPNFEEHKNCCERFESLPMEIRLQIYRERLAKQEDDTVHSTVSTTAIANFV